MPKYIDADEFVRLKREWYCEQCLKRKGMKRGKLQFVYEIGDAPCRACDVDDVISDIEDFPAADVEPKRKTGRWSVIEGKIRRDIDKRIVKCKLCGNYLSMEGVNCGRGDANYCPNCGAKMDMKGEDDAEQIDKI